MTYDLSRDERLERWATVLESCGKDQLTPLLGVEFLSRADCLALRCANSPLALAYADPVLREAGLGGDRFGDAIAFFDLSPRQAHRLLCHCGYLGAMRPAEVARRLQRIAERARRPAWRPRSAATAVARWLHRLAPWAMRDNAAVPPCPEAGD